MFMSSESGSLRKILKRETNRNVLILLHEKGALSSDELMDSLNVTSGMMAYELQVLDDFLVKTTDDKYALSEKGKQAYTILSATPKSVGVSRRWKITWLISTIICIVFSFVLWHIFDSPITSVIRLLFILVCGFIVSYALKVKPKITGRFIYVGLGAFFIGLFLFLLIMVSRGTSYFARYPPGSTGDNILAIVVFVVCYVVGGVIGELIGKKMKYQFPPSRTF